MNQPQTTAPSINTAMVRSVLKEVDVPDIVNAMAIELCDAVDVLRRQFAAQSTYINSLEHRLNGANV